MIGGFGKVKMICDTEGELPSVFLHRLTEIVDLGMLTD
jgi:hypothetical protein